MSNKDEYQQFIQNLNHNLADLTRQHNAFKELLATVNELERTADTDPKSARKLENLRQLEKSGDVAKLREQAEKKVNELNKHLAKLEKEMSQVEQSRQVPTVASKAKKTEKTVTAGKKRPTRRLV